jgi:hypothetical protein
MLISLLLIDNTEIRTDKAALLPLASPARPLRKAVSVAQHKHCLTPPHFTRNYDLAGLSVRRQLRAGTLIWSPFTNLICFWSMNHAGPNWTSTAPASVLTLK